MADFHIWQGAGAPHKAIKRKMDSSRKKNNFPLFKKKYLSDETKPFAALSVARS